MCACVRTLLCLQGSLVPELGEKRGMPAGSVPGSSPLLLRQLKVSEDVASVCRAGFIRVLYADRLPCQQHARACGATKTLLNCRPVTCFQR